MAEDFRAEIDRIFRGKGLNPVHPGASLYKDKHGREARVTAERVELNGGLEYTLPEFIAHNTPQP